MPSIDDELGPIDTRPPKKFGEPEPARSEMKAAWVTVEVDLEEVVRTRNQIPLGVQKREDVYGVVGEKA